MAYKRAVRVFLKDRLDKTYPILPAVKVGSHTTNIPHRIDDLEINVNTESLIKLIPHRIDDLENVVNLVIKLNLIPHRIDDLEKTEMQKCLGENIPHRIDDLEKRY